MAYVFGNAVTDATLRAMPEFQGKKIALQDKARVALKLKHSEDKDVLVRQQVEKLTANAVDCKRTTICLVYNATGDTLTLVTYQDWSGHVDSTPYPPLIGNGQWGVFLHVGDESAGAVDYRGKNKDGLDRDWMQAWRNSVKSNKAYSEVRGFDHWKFKHSGVWAVVAEKMGDSNLMHIDKHDGGYSIVAIGRAPTSIYEAVLTHPNISPF